MRRALPALLAAFPAAACGPAPSDPIPYPDLAGVDPDVVRAIDQARANLREDLTATNAWGQLGMRYFAH